MSEVRTTSSTGGQKGVKPERHDLIPIDPIDWIARVYGFGAEKYGEDHNWRKGYEYSKSYASLQRHLRAFWSGEDLDPESGLPHLAHAAFHVFALLEWTQGPEKDRYAEHDDRYRPAGGGQPAPEEPEEPETDTFDLLRGAMDRQIFDHLLGDLPNAFDKSVFAPFKTPHVDIPAGLLYGTSGLPKIFFPADIPADLFSRKNLARAYVRGTEKARKPEWGVGDEVRFHTVDWSGFAKGELHLVREFGGSWKVKGRPSVETLWSDKAVTEAIGTGTVSAYAGHFTVVRVDRQRRPWRVDSTDQWRDGDRVTLANTWVRENGVWDAVGYRPTTKGRDEHFNEVIRERLQAGLSVTFDLVDLTHETDKVRALGG